jgi:DNA-binding HxlR family transcriptional regulator
MRRLDDRQLNELADKGLIKRKVSPNVKAA